MDRTVISRDGTSLAYARSGRGPAVVLVSGAMSTGATTAPLAARLADHCEVIVYDRRGRGGSGDTQPYAVAREVEDLGALIGEVGGGAALYGVSSGGALALEAAASGLPGVTRVAVYEPPFTLSEEQAGARRRYTERLTEALRRGAHGDAVELFLSLTGLAPEMIASARSSPMWAGMEAVAPTLAYDDAVMGGGSVPRERLASVGVPVLAVAGGASPAWMREAAEAVADAVPDGAYRCLEDQNHMVDPDALAPVLVDFLGA